MKIAATLTLALAMLGGACGGSSAPGGGTDAGADDGRGPVDAAGSSGEADAGGSGSDAGGNPGPAPVLVDTKIERGPTSVLRADGEASFSFGCDSQECAFECSWDEDAWGDCSSPASRSGWTHGEHTFSVRAKTADALDTSPAVATFIVDATVPVVSFTEKPSTQPNTRSSTFVFSCSEQSCEYSCSLDDAAFAPCTSNTSFEDLAAGSHTLKVSASDAAGNRADSTTHSWTLSFGWRAVAVAGFAACGISAEHKLYCWGLDRDDLLGDGGATSEEPEARAVPQRVGSASNWESLVAGAQLFCALNSQSERYCWGSNDSRQFGDASLDSETHYSEPTRVAANFPTLSLGQYHACGIDSAAQLLCWGGGGGGALGDGDSDYHEVATPSAVGVATWKSVAAGDRHTCGVQSTGTLHCFGNNSSGECGQPSTTTTVALPAQVGTDSDWASVSAGAGFTCAVKANHQLYCWGENSAGTLGNGTRENTHIPTRVGADSDWKSVRAYNYNACGVTSVGRAYCWGDNRRAQIGSILADIDTPTPQAVAIDDDVAYVAGYWDLRCALTTSDQIRCWGDNNTSGGGLGRGIRGTEIEPFALDSGYVALSISSDNADPTASGGCGIKQDGKLYCWGLGSFIGQSTTLLALEPTPISQETGWTAIEVANRMSPMIDWPYDPYGHTCGIRSGALYCWGHNQFGQLGLGDTTDRQVPTEVTAVQDTWTDVSVGTASTCAITTGKRIYCWGKNARGEVGVGDSNQRNSPQWLGFPEDWDQVNINGDSVVAHRENGTIWLWGGMLGPNIPVQADEGVQGVAVATDWVDIKAGPSHWCGVKSSGAVFCRQPWGAALLPVMGVENVQTLFRFNSRTCGKDNDGQLICFHNGGSNWVKSEAPNFVPMTGADWLSFDVAGELACGIKTTGQRFCRGPRRAGSFGDSFDERLPAQVLAPQ